MPADWHALIAGPLEARWIPALGMVGASLRHEGREVLGQRGGIEAYRSRGSTFGVPLLAPWANRLGGFAYRVEDRWVALEAGAPRVRADEHGLPIHGLLAAEPGWEVLAATERVLSAELRFHDDPAVLESFPFPHTFRLDVELSPTTLTVRSTVTPARGGRVPIAFGFHPYFTLPGVAREDLVLAHGAMTRLTLDGRGLPDGGRAPVPAATGTLGETALDDLFAELGAEPAVTLSGGGRSLTVRLLAGFTHLQLFAPSGAAAVAIEPMTAPTDALRTGDGLRVVDAPFSAVWSVEVRGGA